MQDKEIVQIAIDGNRLAIFGSMFGYVGPVIQDYTPFASDEAIAIAEARARVASMGRQCADEIARPCITRMSITYSKPRKSPKWMIR